MQTPMAIINSKVESLMQNQELTEEQMSNIQMIYTATYRMSTMNRSLLLLSKIENNQYPVDKSLDFSEFIANILLEFEEMIAHKNLSKEWNITPGVEVAANEFLSSTIVYNLLKNAIAHNVENGHIKVTLDANTLVVQNSGYHLEEDPKELFERFRKSGNNSNSTGLVLAIVKKSCESQGWMVDYDYFQKHHILTIHFSKNSIKRRIRLELRSILSLIALIHAQKADQ